MQSAFIHSYEGRHVFINHILWNCFITLTITFISTVFLNYVSSSRKWKEHHCKQVNCWRLAVWTTATVLLQGQKSAMTVKDNMDYSKDPVVCKGEECWFYFCKNYKGAVTLAEALRTVLALPTHQSLIISIHMKTHKFLLLLVWMICCPLSSGLHNFFSDMVSQAHIPIK